MLLSRILSRASLRASPTASLLSSPPQTRHPPLLSGQCRALAYGSPGKVVPSNQFTFHATPFRQYGISSSASPEHTQRVSNSKATKASGHAENPNQSGDRSAGESKVSSETETDDEDSEKDFYQWLDSFVKKEGYKEKTRDEKGGYVIYELVPRPGVVDVTQAVENDATEGNTAEKGS